MIELAEEEIFKMVLKSDLDFRTAPWPSVSNAAKDCVKRLLNRDPSQRATAAEVLNHPWLTQQGLQSDEPLDNVVIQRMRKVSHQSALLQGGPRSSVKGLPATPHSCQTGRGIPSYNIVLAALCNGVQANCYNRVLLPRDAEALRACCNICLPQRCMSTAQQAFADSSARQQACTMPAVCWHDQV